MDKILIGQKRSRNSFLLVTTWTCTSIAKFFVPSFSSSKIWQELQHKGFILFSYNSMEVPAKSNFTSSIFFKHYFYFVKNYHRNTATANTQNPATQTSLFVLPSQHLPKRWCLQEANTNLLVLCYYLFVLTFIAWKIQMLKQLQDHNFYSGHFRTNDGFHGPLFCFVWWKIKEKS